MSQTIKLLAAVVLTLVCASCGSTETLADEQLDRPVTLRYEVPEILEGESFVVRAWTDVVVGERQRFSVSMVDSELGVSQDTCEEALEFAIEYAESNELESSGECVERSLPVTERFHEVRVTDASGEVTLMLSSEATMPYTVNVILDTEDEHSGCPAIGTVTLEPDQDLVEMAVDDYACDGD